MKVAIDSNILLYVEGVDDDQRRLKAGAVMNRLPSSRSVVPVQVLGEVFRVLRRKAKRSAEECRLVVEKWRRLLEPHETSLQAFDDALELAERHDFQIWDAIILAASSEAGCSVLLSEDMQDGFVWRGVTIVNPFASPEHPLLSVALDPA